MISVSLSSILNELSLGVESIANAESLSGVGNLCTQAPFDMKDNAREYFIHDHSDVYFVLYHRDLHACRRIASKSLNCIKTKARMKVSN
jgi:hypothetical protein